MTFAEQRLDSILKMAKTKILNNVGKVGEIC